MNDSRAFSGHFRPVGRNHPSRIDVVLATRAADRLGRLDHSPSGRIGHQGGKYCMIELMAAANCAVGGKQRLAGECEVADGVEDLVTHEFIGEAQAVRVENAVLGDDQCIGERSAERVAGAPQLRHVLHETESTGARNFAAENLWLDIESKRLLAYKRGIKLNLGLHPKTAAT